VIPDLLQMFKVKGSKTGHSVT